jgi:hypothetical protein
MARAATNAKGIARRTKEVETALKRSAEPVILTAQQIEALHVLDGHVGSAVGALGEIKLRAAEALELGVPRDQVLAAAGVEPIGQLLDFIANLELAATD